MALSPGSTEQRVPPYTHLRDRARGEREEKPLLPPPDPHPARQIHKSTWAGDAAPHSPHSRQSPPCSAPAHTGHHRAPAAAITGLNVTVKHSLTLIPKRTLQIGTRTPKQTKLLGTCLLLELPTVPQGTNPPAPWPETLRSREATSGPYRSSPSTCSAQLRARTAIPSPAPRSCLHRSGEGP